MTWSQTANACETGERTHRQMAGKSLRVCFGQRAHQRGRQLGVANNLELIVCAQDAFVLGGRVVARVAALVHLLGQKDSFAQASVPKRWQGRERREPRQERRRYPACWQLERHPPEDLDPRPLPRRSLADGRDGQQLNGNRESCAWSWNRWTLERAVAVIAVVSSSRTPHLLLAIASCAMSLTVDNRTSVPLRLVLPSRGGSSSSLIPARYVGVRTLHGDGDRVAFVDGGEKEPTVDKEAVVLVLPSRLHLRRRVRRLRVVSQSGQAATIEAFCAVSAVAPVSARSLKST